MKIRTSHYVAIAIAISIVLTSLLVLDVKAFFFMIGLAILIVAFPFVLSLAMQNKINAEKEEMFLEFTRNLVESVKTGTPISKSIMNVGNKNYGVLTPNIKKLSNQISFGIPLGQALVTFSKDVNNRVISRALTLIGQAEKAGGEIGEILESVAGAVSVSDKLKKERKAAVSSLVIQGYIIFIVFIVIILIMQFQILPMISNISGAGLGIDSFSGAGLEGSSLDQPLQSITQDEISKSFLYLLLVQGFFSGLAIGKLSEGDVRAGIKHSFTLMLFSFLISAGASLLFG